MEILGVNKIKYTQTSKKDYQDHRQVDSEMKQVLGAVDLTPPRATVKGAKEIASLQNQLANNTHTHKKNEKVASRYLKFIYKCIKDQYM
jgi:hypothetical protein